MDKETKNYIDNLLESIFGRFGTLISLGIGILLVVVGIIIFATNNTTMTKGKSIATWVCIGIGCIGIVSGIVQMIFR
jgi:type IV secretory pathway VirB6-like protein